MQKHPGQMRVRQFVPAAFVLTLLLCFLTSVFSQWGMWGFVSVLVLYLVVNAGYSTVLAGRVGTRLLPFLCYAFLLMHIGYGSGFMLGLVKFWNRWKG